MNFKELLKRAQFHGAKILVDTRFSWCWSLSMIILFCSSVMVLYVTIQRYFSGPTHIVKTNYARKQVMFPTVVICPEISYPNETMDQFVKEIKYPPSLNATYIRSVLVQLAAFSSPDVVFNIDDLDRIQEVLDYNNLDINSAALRLTPKCEKFLLKCRWLNSIVDCSSLFTMDITRVGYCCTFNGRSLRRELNKNGYKKPTQTDENTYYVDKIGHTNSLMVALDQRSDLYDIDLVYKWVAFQTGQHYVDNVVNGTPISPGEEFWASYKTRNIQASEEIVDISSELRHCRLPTEPLKYFPVYHKTYCLMECEMERTIRECHCLKFTHPNLPGIPICGARSLQCSRGATISYAIDECNCQPTCNVEIESSQFSTFDLIQAPTIDTFYDGLDLERVSVIRVFIPTLVERIFQRKSYFTAINLFSQLGGVFNVFFGCSILTVLELIMLAWRAVRTYIYRAH
ncbi:unnamed protein product [Euphydryas editha]|uniref:Sodium channel protein Nach n=1 Tax=Euphydryas editha TaxID=104508 RepID=A0AAU9TX64_EUPED|nr:unnamed protein product [Euphydryas editha]